MAANDSMKALDEAVATARESYNKTIERADLALENFRNERARDILASESEIAELESQLELYDALERERDAARVRMEIANSYDRHKAVVAGADARLRQAIENHARAYTAAGMGLECAINAALARAAN
jgi:hypothetical protein